METEKEWMEKEEKKEYLKSYQKAVRRENDILEEIQQLRAEKMFPALHMEGAPGAAGPSDLSAYVVKIDELIERLKNERLRKILLREEIERDINRLKDEGEKAVLRYRYIQGLKWEEVAERAGYSWKGVHNVHSRALNHFHCPGKTDNAYLQKV